MTYDTDAIAASEPDLSFCRGVAADVRQKSGTALDVQAEKMGAVKVGAKRYTCTVRGPSSRA